MVGGAAEGLGGMGGGAGLVGATVCGGADGVATLGGAAGNGVPQKPQNLLPAGNALWHCGQTTWGTPGARDGGPCAAGAAACRGLPQRAQVAENAGFMFPQEVQRM